MMVVMLTWRLRDGVSEVVEEGGGIFVVVVVAVVGEDDVRFLKLVGHGGGMIGYDR